MPRPPDPNSKTSHVIWWTKPGQEELAKGLREVCARDGLTMGDVFASIVAEWLKRHNWPPGNPQTQLDKPIPEKEELKCNSFEQGYCRVWDSTCPEAKRIGKCPA